METAATFNDWLVPVDLTYEIDVWAVSPRAESARAQFVASADDEALVRLTVQTNVAQFYYTLRFLDSQAEILRQTVASYREQVRIYPFQVGRGSPARSCCLKPSPAGIHASAATGCRARPRR